MARSQNRVQARSGWTTDLLVHMRVGSWPGWAGLLYPLARAGIGSKPGWVRLQHMLPHMRARVDVGQAG